MLSSLSTGSSGRVALSNQWGKRQTVCNGSVHTVVFRFVPCLCLTACPCSFNNVASAIYLLRMHMLSRALPHVTLVGGHVTSFASGRNRTQPHGFTFGLGTRFFTPCCDRPWGSRLTVVDGMANKNNGRTPHLRPFPDEFARL